jgi:hypothetical protein
MDDDDGLGVGEDEAGNIHGLREGEGMEDISF